MAPPAARSRKKSSRHSRCRRSINRPWTATRSRSRRQHAAGGHAPAASGSHRRGRQRGRPGPDGHAGRIFTGAPLPARRERRPDAGARLAGRRLTSSLEPHGPSRRQHPPPRRGHRGRRPPSRAGRAARRPPRRAPRSPGASVASAFDGARASAWSRPGTNSGSPARPLVEAAIYDSNRPMVMALAEQAGLGRGRRRLGSGRCRRDGASARRDLCRRLRPRRHDGRRLRRRGGSFGDGRWPRRARSSKRSDRAEARQARGRRADRVVRLSRPARQSGLRAGVVADPRRCGRGRPGGAALPATAGLPCAGRLAVSSAAPDGPSSRRRASSLGEPAPGVEILGTGGSARLRPLVRPTVSPRSRAARAGRGRGDASCSIPSGTGSRFSLPTVRRMRGELNRPVYSWTTRSRDLARAQMLAWTAAIP